MVAGLNGHIGWRSTSGANFVTKNGNKIEFTAEGKEAAENFANQHVIKLQTEIDRSADKILNKYVSLINKDYSKDLNKAVKKLLNWQHEKTPNDPDFDPSRFNDYQADCSNFQLLLNNFKIETKKEIITQLTDEKKANVIKNVLNNCIEHYEHKQLEKESKEALQTIKHALDHRVAREFLGRIDAIFRTVVGVGIAAFQLGKVVIKSAVCILTLGQLARLSFTRTWGVEGLALDGAKLVCTIYKTAIAFRDIIMAPEQGYTSAVVELAIGLSEVFRGPQHNLRRNGEPLYTPSSLIKRTVKNEPFFQIHKTNKVKEIRVEPRMIITNYQQNLPSTLLLPTAPAKSDIG